MKKQITIVAGLLLTLGTAVAATLSSTDAQAVKPAATASAETVAKQSEQIVGLWKAHASSAASVPMARPL